MSQRAPSPAGFRRIPGPLLGAGAAAGLLIMVWASVTGPVALFGSAGPPPPQRSPEATPSMTPTPGTAPPSGRELFGDRQPRFDLSWIGDLLTWAVLLGSLAIVAAALQWAWRHRWRRPPPPVEIPFDVLPSIQDAADALARDADAQLRAVGEGAPGDGIVRCWLRLEESVADAGLPRERWETSAEFTVRVLKSLDVDPRPIAVLAELYREARFSAHRLGEPSRAAAEAALRAFHVDLARART